MTVAEIAAQDGTLLVEQLLYENAEVLVELVQRRIFPPPDERVLASRQATGFDQTRRGGRVRPSEGWR